MTATAITKTNNTETGGKRGRPCKFDSTEQLQKRIDAYFRECDEGDGIYTITGLALALDLTRQGLWEYERKPEFSYTIKRAKTKVAAQVEYRLLTVKGNVTGMIFWLKNNAGWTDEYRQKNENTFTFADFAKIAAGAEKREGA